MPTEGLQMSVVLEKKRNDLNELCDGKNKSEYDSKGIIQMNYNFLISSLSDLNRMSWAYLIRVLSIVSPLISIKGSIHWAMYVV